MNDSLYMGESYLRWDEIEELCHALAAAAPEWVSLESVGESREGRPLWLLCIGAQQQRPEDKPALWFDGGTHAAEWTGVMSVLYSVSQWVTSLRDGNEAMSAFFTQHTVYAMPCISPDGYHAIREGAPFLRSTMRGPRDGRPRTGLHPSDVDGDGKVRWMRWKHPTGSWVCDGGSGSVKMRKRRLDDDPSEAYVLASEGTLLEWDGVRWLAASQVHGLDLNRNFPGSWAPFEMFGMDGGDYPMSEPESRAVVEAFRARPRIAAAITNHTYTGCILTQPYREATPLGDPDIDLMEALATSCVEGTGYRVIKVFPDFTYDPKKSIVGVWSDTLSTTFGVPGYTVELWDPFGYAGLTMEKPAEFFRKPDETLILGLLEAFEKEPGAIEDWRPFDHPQLGEVEIGGIEYQTTVRNPPVRLLGAECERGHTIAERMRVALPKVEAEVAVTPLGEGVLRIEAVFDNVGYLPTSGLRYAESIGTAPPLYVTLEGAEVLEGAQQQTLGWLDGWGGAQVTFARHGIYPGLPLDGGPRARAVWVVRSDAEMTLSWDAGRAGRGMLTLAAPEESFR